MADPCKYEGDQVLLVEGRNDCHVVLNICEKHNIPESFGIYECGNDVKALSRLNALISAPDRPQTIGLVIDADNGIEPRWQSFCAKIGRYGYNISRSPDKNGTIIMGAEGAEFLPRIGIWFMPDNEQKGMLEDFCLYMIKETSKKFIVDVVSNARQEIDLCTFREGHFSKAVIHTYLAWQDEPGFPLGVAVHKILKTDSDLTRRFIGWLNRLFNPSDS